MFSEISRKIRYKWRLIVVYMTTKCNQILTISIVLPGKREIKNYFVEELAWYFYSNVSFVRRISTENIVTYVWDYPGECERQLRATWWDTMFSHTWSTYIGEYGMWQFECPAAPDRPVTLCPLCLCGRWQSHCPRLSHPGRHTVYSIHGTSLPATPSSAMEMYLFKATNMRLAPPSFPATHIHHLHPAPGTLPQHIIQ